MEIAAVLGELSRFTFGLENGNKFRSVSFATFTSVSNLEDCFNSAPHWVDGKQVVSHF